MFFMDFIFLFLSSTFILLAFLTNEENSWKRAKLKDDIGTKYSIKKNFNHPIVVSFDMPECVTSLFTHISLSSNQYGAQNDGVTCAFYAILSAPKYLHKYTK